MDSSYFIRVNIANLLHNNNSNYELVNSKNKRSRINDIK